MKKKDVDKFKKFQRILEDKKKTLLGNAMHTLQDDMTLDTSDLPDDMDLASSEYLQSFQFRLRSRERTFLSKIDSALRKIDEGEYGVCESCGDEISQKRLEARPETTMCIKCKEEQEQEERQFSE